MKFIIGIVALAVVLADEVPCASAATQEYPNKPVRFVLPMPPGGGADVIARLLAPKLGETFGQQLVIDNRAGAGGNIAAEVVARSAPDGYTVLEGFIGHAMSASLYRKLNYDLLKDFIPVTLLASAPFMMAINPSVPAHSVKELIALAKAQPGKLNYASSGNGAPGHLAMVLFNLLTGTEMRHIPYKGGAAAATDLIAGQVQAMFTTVVVLLPHCNSGKLRAMGIASSHRIPALPELPTIDEQGVPGFETTTWFGVMVPVGTPNAIVEKLHSEFVAALNTPDVRERLNNQYYVVAGSTPAEFAAYVKSEMSKWAKVIKAANAQVE